MLLIPVVTFCTLWRHNVQQARVITSDIHYTDSWAKELIEMHPNSEG